MRNLPDDPRRIRARIRRYERKLRVEKQRFGRYRDGAGKRHFLGPLYLLMGDLDGALASYLSFETEFPDDSGEPGQYLCWALALHRAGRSEEARRKLEHTVFLNLYIVPHLLGMEMNELDIWHGSSDQWRCYLQYIPEEYFAMWEEEDLEWADRVYHDAEFQAVLDRYVEIQRKLKDLPRGPMRTRLVDEEYSLRDSRGRTQ